MGALVVLTTVANAKTADRLAQRIVREKKAACVSLVPSVISRYRWMGKIKRTREALLFIKTTRAAWPELLRFLEKNHPYDVPEILALPVSQGSKAYLSWLRRSLVLCLVMTGGLCGIHPLWAKDVVKNIETKKEIYVVPLDEDAITPDELRSIRTKDPSVRLFDARSREEFKKEHIAGALLPLPDEVYTQEELFRQKIIPVAPDRSVSLIQATASLSRATVIVTYCNSHCALSKNLMLRLKTIGFTNVRYLAGGIDSWREKGYPLEVQNP